MGRSPKTALVGLLVVYTVGLFTTSTGGGSSYAADLRGVAPNTGKMHEAVYAGVPLLISIPKKVIPSTPIVVMYHGFGPPASPQALALAIPPIPGAISVYPWLPLFGPRAVSGDSLAQRQAEDYAGRLLFPVMTQVATELPVLIHDLSATYHLSETRRVVIFGFSAGGAAALASLSNTALRSQAVVVLNAPLSISQAVKGYERQTGTSYQWTAAGRAAADRYDIAAHAPELARAHVGSTFLFLQSDHDAGYEVSDAHRAADRLMKEAAKYTAMPDVRASDIENADHYVLDPASRRNPAASASQVAALISSWISRHAFPQSEAPPR